MAFPSEIILWFKNLKKDLKMIIARKQGNLAKWNKDLNYLKDSENSTQNICVRAWIYFWLDLS